MNEHERSEMERLTEEAIERMKMMNGKGKGHDNAMPPGPPFLNMTGTSREEHKDAPGNGIKGLIPKKTDIFRLLNFQNIKWDSDVSIIVAVLLLLNRDGSDELLILALIYILL